uniref:Protein kinase domain-containing protein n=1 Tax=Pyrodinium bahamense TaxID=73915 RepID=A0A7S0A9Z5_9DINO
MQPIGYIASQMLPQNIVSWDSCASCSTTASTEPDEVSSGLSFSRKCPVPTLRLPSKGACGGPRPPDVSLAGKCPVPVLKLPSEQVCCPQRDSNLLDSNCGLESHGYSLGEVVGAGSVTTVYRVTRQRDGRELAVKYIRSQDEEMRQFARAEYEIMRCLEHSAIVHVKALLETDFGLWLCMEWCEDGCVQAYVEAHGYFQEDTGQKLLLQCAHGVEHLHSRCIVHRDLKPDNLLLQHNAVTLKICDFNSAGKLDSGALSHRGTPLYSAPEVRFGQLWNELVDIWAFGLCAYFMLRGRLPFDGERKASVKALRSGRLPKISWEGMSENARALVEACIVVDRSKRPAATELLAHPIFVHSPREEAPVVTYDKTFRQGCPDLRTVVSGAIPCTVS